MLTRKLFGWLLSNAAKQTETQYFHYTSYDAAKRNRVIAASNVNSAFYFRLAEDTKESCLPNGVRL